MLFLYVASSAVVTYTCTNSTSQFVPFYSCIDIGPFRDTCRCIRFKSFRYDDHIPIQGIRRRRTVSFGPIPIFDRSTNDIDGICWILFESS